MPNLEFTEEQRDVLTQCLREIVERDRFPLSPRVRCLKAILAKLEPPAPTREPYPPMKPPGAPSILLSKKRQRRQR